MSKNDEVCDALILALPDSAKKLLVGLVEATMIAWEEMDEETQEGWGSPQKFLGTQVFLAVETILTHEED